MHGDQLRCRRGTSSLTWKFARIARGTSPSPRRGRALPWRAGGEFHDAMPVACPSRTNDVRNATDSRWFRRSPPRAGQILGHHGGHVHEELLLLVGREPHGMSPVSWLRIDDSGASCEVLPRGSLFQARPIVKLSDATFPRSVPPRERRVEPRAASPRTEPGCPQPGRVLLAATAGLVTWSSRRAVQPEVSITGAISVGDRLPASSR